MSNFEIYFPLFSKVTHNFVNIFTILKTLSRTYAVYVVITIKNRVLDFLAKNLLTR